MARVDPLDANTLRDIANQIGKKIGMMPDAIPCYWIPNRIDHLKAAQSILIKISFPVWEASAPQTEPTDTLSWHHQVLFDNVPLAFARSKPQADSMSIFCFYYSQLAQNIDEGIQNIDNTPDLDDTWKAQLLFIPTHLSYGIMLVNTVNATEKKIVPVFVPPQYPVSHSLLAVQDMNTFLTALYSSPGISPFEGTNTLGRGKQ